MVVILRCGAAMRGIDRHAAFAQGGADVVLGGKGIAAGDKHIRAGLTKHLRKIGGLGFQMDGNDNGQTLERLFTFKVARDAAEHGHVQAGPFDFLSALGSQGSIFNDGRHSLTPQSVGRWKIEKGNQDGGQEIGNLDVFVQHHV